MKIIKTKIILAAIVVLAILVCGFAVWKLYLPTPQQAAWLPASTLPTGYSVSQNYTWYSLQNNAIYCMENTVSNVDAPTFVASSLDGYGKDKNHVYWCNQVVADANPETFTILSKEYAKDTSYVFLVGGSIIVGADPTTFAPVLYSSPNAIDPLQTGYGKDANHVYNLDHAIPNADPATFTLDPVPSDKNWIYLSNTVVGPARLIVDNAQYAKALPAECNPTGAESIQPQLYPSAFSTDGSVIGYTNDFAICIIDKKANTVQVYPYGTQQGVSLSKDGSKVLFFKYQKGDGVDGETCADCGQYSYDRVTEKVQRASPD